MLAVSAENDEFPVVNSNVEDDRHLLQAVAEKCAPAYETLFHRYHSRVYRFVIRIVNTHELAEEVTGDSLYALWTHADRFRGQSSVSTWLLGIAYKKALKAVEKDARQRRMQGSESALLQMEDVDPEKNPETHTSDKLIDRHLQRALNQISINHKSVIQLTAMGLSSKEIAEIMDCSPNTVKTRMFHARRRLWTLLEREGIDTQSRELSI